MTSKSTKKKDRFRYSIIPARAITDPNITAWALRVLALLGRHGDDDGWCRRSQVRMAEELNCSRGTIQNALDTLIGRENGKGYVERREETRPGVRPQEGRHPHCSYSYRVRLDLEDDDDDPAGGGASGLAPTVPARKHGVPSDEKHGVPISVAPLTEHSPCEGPLGNTLTPAAAGESENVASLGQGEPDRFPEFRSVVAKSWPGGWVADNETAAKKAWTKVTRIHPTDLVLACAALHGAAKTEAKNRRKDGSTQHMRLPANWLRDGDWEGYIPEAQQVAVEEAKIATALGNVRRALGDGVFGLLKQEGMADAAIARLDGMTLIEPADFTVTSAFQKTLLDRHASALERHLRARPNFRLVQPVGRVS